MLEERLRMVREMDNLLAGARRALCAVCFRGLAMERFDPPLEEKLGAGPNIAEFRFWKQWSELLGPLQDMREKQCAICRARTRTRFDGCGFAETTYGGQFVPYVVVMGTKYYRDELGRPNPDLQLLDDNSMDWKRRRLEEEKAVKPETDSEEEKDW